MLMQPKFGSIDIVSTVIVFTIDEEKDMRNFIFTTLLINTRKQVKIGLAFDCR